MATMIEAPVQIAPGEGGASLALMNCPLRLNRIVQHGLNLLNVPIVALTLKGERPWLSVSEQVDATSARGCLSFCIKAAKEGDVLVVSDTRADERFAHHPMVLAGPRVRSLMAVPIRSRQGKVVGALVAFDQCPRGYDRDDLSALFSLSALVEALVDLHERTSFLDRRFNQRRFVQMAIHDLKNPLSVIMSAVELLKSDSGILDTEPVILEQLIAASEQLNQRMDATIDLVAADETGALPLSRQPSDLGQILAGVSRSLDQRAKARGVDLVTDVPNDLPVIDADPIVIQRVLENLVGNALQHARENSRIDIGISFDDDTICVSVRDHGQWTMPAERRRRIFEPFRHGTVTQRATGSIGMGLAFCRAAILAHSGEISVEAPPSGTGNVFRCVFPRH